MGFIGNATNLIIIGPTGADKTYLLCALGIETCKQTSRVLYIRMPDLMRNFENQRDNLRELTKYRKRIGTYMQNSYTSSSSKGVGIIQPSLLDSIPLMNGMKDLEVALRQIL